VSEFILLALREELRLTVFESRVLRRMYSTPNVIRIIKQRRMRWAVYVAKVHTGFWWGNPKERDNLEDRGIDWWIILKWIFRKGVEAWTGLISVRTGTGGGLL
jgi:hypothetical protein